MNWNLEKKEKQQQPTAAAHLNAISAITIIFIIIVNIISSRSMILNRRAYRSSERASEKNVNMINEIC